MARPDLRLSAELPHPYAEMSPADRVNFLKELREANPSLPDFSHLNLYPDTASSLLGVEDMLETAIEGYSVDKTPQVIVIMGHQGNGKSANALQIIRYLEARNPDPNGRPRVRYVGYDDALNLGRDLIREYRKGAVLPRIRKMNPAHVSGTRTQDDYEAANNLLSEGVKEAIGAGGIIIVEGPGYGGFVENNELVGKNRAMTVFSELSNRIGFYGLKYNLFVAALVANEEVFREAIRKRTTETKKQSSERTGASGLGQKVADEDLKNVLAWHFHLPSSTFDDLPANSNYIAAFFVWLIGRELRLKNRTMILENSQSVDMSTPYKEAMKRYDEFRKMSIGRKISAILTEA